MSNLLEEVSILITATAYSDGKIHAVVPTASPFADLNYTRGSLATRVDVSKKIVNSQGVNVPRLDYSELKASYLFGRQSTNKLKYSEDLSNSDWDKFSSSVVSSNVLNPKGEVGCYEYIADNITGNNQYIRIGNGNYANDLVQTYSFFAKYNTKQYLKLSAINFNGDDNFAVNFDLINGTKTSEYVDGTPINRDFSITEEFGGWYRISITCGLESQAGDTMNFELNFTDSASPTWGAFGRVVQTTTTADKVYLWGGQLEEGSLTSYIPTGATVETRLADKSNTNGLTSLINSEEGTIWLRLKALENNATVRSISFSDGSTSNRIIVSLTGTNNQLNIQYIKGGTASFNRTITLTDVTVFFDLIITFKQDEFKLFIDFAQVGATDTSGDVMASGVLNTIALDRGDESSEFFEGNLEILSVWKRILTTTEITSLDD